MWLFLIAHLHSPTRRAQSQLLEKISQGVGAVDKNTRLEVIF